MKETRTGMYPTGWNAAPLPYGETSNLHTRAGLGPRLEEKLAQWAITRAWWEGALAHNNGTC